MSLSEAPYIVCVYAKPSTHYISYISVYPQQICLSRTSEAFSVLILFTLFIHFTKMFIFVSRFRYNTYAIHFLHDYTNSVHVFLHE